MIIERTNHAAQDAAAGVEPGQIELSGNEPPQSESDGNPLYDAPPERPERDPMSSLSYADDPSQWLSGPEDQPDEPQDRDAVLDELFGARDSSDHAFERGLEPTQDGPTPPPTPIPEPPSPALEPAPAARAEPALKHTEPLEHGRSNQHPAAGLEAALAQMDGLTNDVPSAPEPDVSAPTALDNEPGVGTPGYYQGIYREFIAARRACHQRIDGLTFDTFLERVKQKEADFKAKYEADAVRLEVYIKDGKAGLKARRG